LLTVDDAMVRVLAVDANNVYWGGALDCQDCELRKMAKPPQPPQMGAVHSTLLKLQHPILGVAIDETSVFVASSPPSASPQLTFDGVVWSVAVADGATAFAVATGLTMPSALAVASDSLYGTHVHGAWRAPTAGCPACPAGGCAVCPTPIADLPGACAIALDSTRAYVRTRYENASGPQGEVFAIQLSGSSGTGELLIAHMPGLCGIVVDAESVYFSGPDGIHGVSTGGGAARLLVPADQNDPITAGLAADADRVYWATRKGVWRVSKTGGRAEQLARIDPGYGVLALTVDDTNVYWGGAAADGTGAVWRILRR
jgi:hypothetical protein